MDQPQIEWITDNLSLDRIARLFGAENVLRGRAYCTSLGDEQIASGALGAWTANQREEYAAYRSLARLRGREIKYGTGSYYLVPRKRGNP